MRGAGSLIVVMIAIGGAGAAVVVGCSSTALPPTGSSSGTSSGAAGADAGATDGGATDARGPKGYGEGPCSSDAECATGRCFQGGSGGGGGGGGGGAGQTYCSAACTTESFATVCVPPLDGKCSGTGLCRKP